MATSHCVGASKEDSRGDLSSGRGTHKCCLFPLSLTDRSQGREGSLLNNGAGSLEASQHQIGPLPLPHRKPSQRAELQMEEARPRNGEKRTEKEALVTWDRQCDLRHTHTESNLTSVTHSTSSLSKPSCVPKDTVQEVGRRVSGADSKLDDETQPTAKTQSRAGDVAQMVKHKDLSSDPWSPPKNSRHGGVHP